MHMKPIFGRGHQTTRPLAGIYAIAVGSTAIGVAVIMILNMFTPIEYIRSMLAPGAVKDLAYWVDLIVRRILGLLIMSLIGGVILLLVMQHLLKPIAVGLSELANTGPDGRRLIKARQRLINLPFMMIPINIALWILLPGALFLSAQLTGRIDAPAAWTLGIRATMLGFISSTIMSFWMEAYSRRRLIPLFFPNGRLTEVPGTATISISRRIRVFFRLGSLTPLAILVLTLLTLQGQPAQMHMTAREYGHGVIVFSIVLFAIFFLGAGALNRLISRSIADPVNALVATVTAVKSADYDTRVTVVGNDEIARLGDAVNEMIHGLSERELLRDAFGRYVAPEVRDEILSGRTPLDGELRHVSVLFADIRDFTPLTETRDPKQVVRILNRYFAAMAAVIQQHSGLVLQFLGDEIYAVFGAPVRRPDHPQQAFKAALAMQKERVALNRCFLDDGLPELRHGIGLHTGDALVANIGSPDRLSYLLVGDTVNLASRLQTLTKKTGFEIMLSEHTYRHLGRKEKDLVSMERLPAVAIKGKRRPTDCYGIR